MRVLVIISDFIKFTSYQNHEIIMNKPSVKFLQKSLDESDEIREVDNLQIYLF